MNESNPRQFRITSLQLSFGLFDTVVGAFILVAPYHFNRPTFTALQATLPIWGVAFLVAGAALLCAAALAPCQKLLCAAHLLAGSLLLVLALVSGVSGNWAGIPPFVIFGLGVAVAPYLAAGRPGSSPGLDLLTILLGLATGATGLFMLATQGLFSASKYDQIRPYLTAYGAAFLVGGFALVAVHIRPARSPWLERVTHSTLAVVFFAYFIGASFAGNWVGMLYYGGFGTLVLLLPWLGPGLSQVDGTSLRAQLALVLGAAAAVPFLMLMPLYAHQQEDRAVSEQLGRQEALVAALAQDVADYINLHQAAVKVLAGQSGLLALSPAEQQTVLENSQAAYPDVVGFGTVAADGESIARSDDRQGTSWIGDPVFEEIRRTNQPAIGVRISPVINRPIFSLGVPILDADRRFVGMASSSLESSQMATLLSRTDFGEQAYAYLVDVSGLVIAQPNADLVTNFANMSGSPSVAAFQNSPAPSGSLRNAGPAGALLASYAHVPDLGWSIIVERPIAAVLATTRSQLDLLFLGLLLLIAAAAIFGVLSAGWLSRPLATLAVAVDRLAGGDASAPLPASGLAEIVGLATAFGTMRARLAERTAERERAEQALEHQALHDALTGLPNRVLFTNRLKHALADSKRTHSVAVLFLDLDDFKVVNDSLGHDQGDVLLVGVAGRLLGCVRPADTAARLGGDEFTVLLDDIAGESEAVAVADRIAAALRAPMLLQGREVTVKASIGIAVGGSRTDANDLLREADLAMYRAKAKENRRIEVFAPVVGSLAMKRLPLETDCAAPLSVAS